MKHTFPSRIRRAGGLFMALLLATPGRSLTPEEAEKLLTRTDFQSVQSVMDLVKNATGETPEEKAEMRREILRGEVEKRKAVSEHLAEGSFMAEGRSEVARLEVERDLYKALSQEGGLLAAAQKVTQLASESTTANQDQARSEAIKASPVRLTLAGLKAHDEDDGEVYAKAALEFSDEQFDALEESNPELFDALKRYSEVPSEQKALLQELVSDLNNNSAFQTKVRDFSTLKPDADVLVSPLNEVVLDLDSEIAKLGTVNDKLSVIGSANQKLEKLKENEDKATSKMARELALIEELVEQFDEEKGFADLTACEVLAKKLSLEELSDDDKRNCRTEIALFKSNRNLATSSDAKAEGSHAPAAAADKKEEGGVSPAEVASSANDERKKRMAELERNLAQNPDFGYRQLVGNMVVPMACGSQMLNQSMPFAGNPDAEKKLDRLEEGLAAQMTACKLTGYVDEEMSAFSSGLMDGGVLASDAMDKMFGGASAATLTMDQTNDLKSEKKCLDRSAAAMRRGLILSRLEIERVSKEKARSKLFRMRNENPMLYSQELARKRMELIAMGRFSPFTSEDDLSQALYDEYKIKNAEQLHVERNVDQMASNLKIVQTLGIEVNELYSQRIQLVEGSRLQPSTRSYDRPVAPTTSRMAPSRETRLPGSSINGGQIRSPNRAPGGQGRIPRGATTPNFI